MKFFILLLTIGVSLEDWVLNETNFVWLNGEMVFRTSVSSFIDNYAYHVDSILLERWTKVTENDINISTVKKTTIDGVQVIELPFKTQFQPFPAEHIVYKELIESKNYLLKGPFLFFPKSDLEGMRDRKAISLTDEENKVEATFAGTSPYQSFNSFMATVVQKDGVEMVKMTKPEMIWKFYYVGKNESKEVVKDIKMTSISQDDSELETQVIKEDGESRIVMPVGNTDNPEKKLKEIKVQLGANASKFNFTGPYVLLRPSLTINFNSVVRGKTCVTTQLGIMKGNRNTIRIPVKLSFDHWTERITCEEKNMKITLNDTRFFFEIPAEIVIDKAATEITVSINYEDIRTSVKGTITEKEKTIGHSPLNTNDIMHNASGNKTRITIYKLFTTRLIALKLFSYFATLLAVEKRRKKRETRKTQNMQ